MTFYSDTDLHQSLQQSAEESAVMFSRGTQTEIYSVTYGSKPQKLPIQTLENVLGFHAKPKWDAMIGVSLAEGKHRHPSEFHIKFYGIGRKGEEISGTMYGNKPKTEWIPPYGLEADILRRCFGLNSLPPDIPPSETLLRSWLHKVKAMSFCKNLDLDDVVELSPLGQLFPDLYSKGEHYSSAGIGRFIAYAGSGMNWDSLKEDTHTNAQPDGRYLNLDESVIRWMDEGVFSRWLIYETDCPYETLDIIEENVSDEISSFLLEAIDGYYDEISAASIHHLETQNII